MKSSAKAHTVYNYTVESIIRNVYLQVDLPKTMILTSNFYAMLFSNYGDVKGVMCLNIIVLYVLLAVQQWISNVFAESTIN